MMVGYGLGGMAGGRPLTPLGVGLGASGAGLYLLAGTTPNGVYVATVVEPGTAQLTWSELNDGLGSEDKQVELLEASQPHGNRAYLTGAYAGWPEGPLYRNDNVSGLATWTHVELPDPDEGYEWGDAALTVRCICPDPVSADVVYLAVAYSSGDTALSWLYRSPDAGVSWTVTPVILGGGLD
ncbi:MAG: hypothetical protein KKB13_10385, partial [Chloroflexi bacterium]|nr:hypothetical protein [Chloroflexota bacterium]